MKELKCPQCGSVFSVDEADYASIVNQVKNQEFDAEVKARLAELQKQNDIKQEAESLKITHDYQEKLNAKDVELAQFLNSKRVLLRKDFVNLHLLVESATRLCCSTKLSENPDICKS